MTKNVLIVESPAKVKTIKKYLDNTFTVLASYGHVRDLLPKSGAVDPEHNFAMRYAIIEKNAKHVTEIFKTLKSSDALYLATDPDREGEAIAWHIYELMKEKKALKNKPVRRVVFNEITKNAIISAVANPRDISMDLVDAQQARRSLDYLVGFNLSPLLWKKISYGLSAGRVQSPALRMIVEREEEIRKFVIQEYWTVIAGCLFKQQSFTAKLIEYQREKLTQFSVVSEDQADAIQKNLLNLSAGKLKVLKIDKKQRVRNPAAPFTTSTLQQEASYKLGFSAKRTMSTAQKLYEAGYITYMRTDSVALADEAITDIRKTIEQLFGVKNLPKEPRIYKTKAKNAQEAHEAIRPTSCSRAPQDLSQSLTPEQAKLYNLIWQCTVACQMTQAILDTVVVDLGCGGGDNIFRANGSVVTDPGFLKVYREDSEDNKEEIASDSKDKILPPFEVGDVVDLQKIYGQQHFTEPPPRYSEATLVKALEEHGIGRPSTYATIIDTLLARKYAVLDNKRFKPTDIGEVVNGFLTKYFTKYVDYEFTAHLEDELDEIARGKNTFLNIMKEFWMPFKKLLDNIAGSVKKEDVTQKTLKDKCPKCGKVLILRLGRMGRFIGCSGYPECDYTANIDSENKLVEPEFLNDRACPDCNSRLQIKIGRYGRFIGCSNYPNCKFIEPLEKPFDTGIKCPICKEGSILKKKSRYNKYFYSCSRYPECKYALWNEPVAETCPKCGWPILTIKTTKRKGTQKICPVEGCDFGK